MKTCATVKDYFHLDLDPVDIEMRGSGAVLEPGGPLGQKSPWPKNIEGFLGEGMDEDVPYHGSVHFGRIGVPCVQSICAS